MVKYIYNPVILVIISFFLVKEGGSAAIVIDESQRSNVIPARWNMCDTKTDCPKMLNRLLRSAGWWLVCNLAAYHNASPNRWSVPLRRPFTVFLLEFAFVR